MYSIRPGRLFGTNAERGLSDQITYVASYCSVMALSQRRHDKLSCRDAMVSLPSAFLRQTVPGKDGERVANFDSARKRWTWRDREGECAMKDVDAFKALCIKCSQ